MGVNLRHRMYCPYEWKSMKSLMPRESRRELAWAIRPLFSGASPAAAPLNVSEHGFVDAPPATSHLYGQLRLLSRPTHELPLARCRFLRQSRSVVCV